MTLMGVTINPSHESEIPVEGCFSPLQHTRQLAPVGMDGRYGTASSFHKTYQLVENITIQIQKEKREQTFLRARLLPSLR